MRCFERVCVMEERRKLGFGRGLPAYVLRVRAVTLGDA